MSHNSLNPDLVQKMLTKYQLGWVITIEEINSGLINPVFLINNKYILRIEQHTYEQNPDKLKRESVLFKVLPQYAIPTPVLIGFDDSGEIIEAPYLILYFIPGTNLKQGFDQLAEDQQKSVSFEMGELARKIHSIKAEDLNSPLFGNVDSWVEKTNTDFMRFWSVVKNIDYISNILKGEIIATYEQFLKLKWVNVGRLTHGDFSAGNIQIKEGVIVGVFDFEYATIADPLWDLQKLSVRFQLGPAFVREEFLKGYGKTDLSLEEKMRIKMHSYHQGVWELWAVKTQFMPFGDKEIEEGVNILTSTASFDALN